MGAGKNAECMGSSRRAVKLEASLEAQQAGMVPMDWTGGNAPGRTGDQVTRPVVEVLQERGCAHNAPVQRPGCPALRRAGALQIEEPEGEPGSGRVRCNALLGAATDWVATVTGRLTGIGVCSLRGRGGC